MKDENKIEKLCVFDFDQTLMQTPVKKIGVKMWEKYYNTKYPLTKWWSEYHSLDDNVFKYYIRPNKNILYEFNKNINNDDTWVIMLTHRLPLFKDRIKSILNKYKIYFDDHLFRRSYTLKKSNDLEEYLIKFPNLKKIEIWDDDETVINDLKQWAYKVEPWLDLIIIINKI